MSERTFEGNTINTLSLASMVLIDPESLPLGTQPDFTFRYIDIASVVNGRLFPPDAEIEYRLAPSRARRVIRNGDVLMSTVRPNLNAFAYCNIPPGNYIASTGFAVLRAIEGNDPRYILYSILSDDVSRQIDSRVVGSNYPAINSSDVKRLRIPAWKPIQQRRIAEILSTLDEAIEQTEALIAKYQQIKAGLMHDLFTRGVTPNGHLRPTRLQAPHLYKESSLGWIPKEWECFAIGELFTRRTERGRAGLPVMSVTMSGGLIERDSVDRRVESNLLPEGHLLVRRGDIAYNMMRMWQGVLGRAEYDCLVSPAYIVMTPGPNIEPVFAEYLISTESAIAWFKRLSYGVVDDRLRLYFRDLVRIRLAIPRSLPEQHAISKRLQSLESSLHQTAISLAKLRQQKLGLMQDLLTGRVRVKVADPVSR